MEFIWIGLFFVVLIVSFFLAMRSMKNFQDLPTAHLEYSLFLLQNPENLTHSTLKKLHDFALQLDTLISLEKLTKGSQTVLTIFVPNQFITQFPELGLLELEDYISLEPEKDEKKISKNEALPWVIAPKNSKKDLQLNDSFFKKLSLNEMQHFFWQIVLQPLKTNTNFQATIRAMVVEKIPAERVNVAKRIDSLINETTGLIKEAKVASSGTIFESFAKRTIVPKEVSSFELNGEEVLKLLS